LSESRVGKCRLLKRMGEIRYQHGDDIRWTVRKVMMGEWTEQVLPLVTSSQNIPETVFEASTKRKG
jgi:hypothetical protein